MNALPYFPSKCFQLPYSKICKKLENAIFKRSQHSFLSPKLLDIALLRSYLSANFDLSSLERFALLSQKIISTWSIKNLEKTEKCAFQTLTTFWKTIWTFSSNLQNTEKSSFQTLRTLFFVARSIVFHPSMIHVFHPKW